MPDIIQIQLMGPFTITVNGSQDKQITTRNGKATALLQYLMLQHERPVPITRLMETFWSDDDITHPESALKTLISRDRAMLNAISEGLGDCIVSSRGSYCWKCTGNVTIDLRMMEQEMNAAENEALSIERRNEACERVLILYKHHLLDGINAEWVKYDSYLLLKRLTNIMEAYSRRLILGEDYGNAIRVCRQYLQVDDLEDRIYRNLIEALILIGNLAEAREVYNTVANLHYRRLGDKPGQELQQLYENSLQHKDTALDAEDLCRQMHSEECKDSAYVCDYPVFKAIFNFHLRNLDRMNLSMTMGFMTLIRADGKPMEEDEQEMAIGSLMEMLRFSLRKSDAISRFSNTTVAVLLSPPKSDFEAMMNRIKKIFYQEFGRAGLVLQYQCCNMGEEDEKLADNISSAGAENRRRQWKPTDPRKHRK